MDRQMTDCKCDAKFVLIGGGSYGWTHTLITDVACTSALHGMHIVLHDIDPEAVETVGKLCKKISAELDADLRIETTTDLDAALPGADFVGLTISTGGMAADVQDMEIPARHGVLQTVGDTVGPGGWARGLRNIPVIVDIARAVERHAPNAWFMNYSNPMTVLTRTLQVVSELKSIGLCHELQGKMLHIGAALGVAPFEDITVTMAGINHLIFIMEMDVAGHDGLALMEEYYRDRENFKPIGDLGVPEQLMRAGGVSPYWKVTADFLERTGYMLAAGDSHPVEFFSHYLKDADAAAEWDFDLKAGQKAHTFARSTSRGKRRQKNLDMIDGRTPLWNKHSHEHAANIIEALMGSGGPFVTPVNTGNIGQIDNLPREAVVETLAHVDANGVHPTPVGVLPEILTWAVMRHIPVQEMIVEAGLTGNRELAELALACDPMIPSPDIAAKIASDFFDEQRHMLPQFNDLWAV
jgi:alpha-galactosidase/6-phospho-beta-glucosidase family protein